MYQSLRTGSEFLRISVTLRPRVDGDNLKATHDGQKYSKGEILEYFVECYGFFLTVLSDFENIL